MKIEKVFKINKKWFVTIYFIICFIPMVSAQVYTDEELGFDRELIKQEIQSTGYIKNEDIDSYIIDLRKTVILRQKLGLEAWLETADTIVNNIGSRKKFAKKNITAISQVNESSFPNCETYTFDSTLTPPAPLSGWALSFNENPSYGSLEQFYDQNFTVSDAGKQFIIDANEGFRFQVFAPDEFTVTNDPYIGRPPTQVDATNVVRIGNSHAGWSRERISRDFEIQNLNDFIYYNFAIILQDPNHPGRPFYAIRILRNGLVVPCSTVIYEAVNSTNAVANGFAPSTNNVFFRPWSTNIIKPADFGAVIGDQITIEVSVSDCGGGGHFGYGYFDIQCITEDQVIKISNAQQCINNSTTFSTTLDSANTNFTWEIKDQNDNIIPISNPDASSIIHTFRQIGTYTITLNVPYFTTNNDSICNVISTFKKTIQVNECISCTDCTSFDLIKNGKYLVSGWVKESDPTQPEEQMKNFTNAAIRVSFKDVGGVQIGTEQNFHTSGEIIDGWQRIIGEFIVPENVDDFSLELVNPSENNNEKTAYFDDIRVLPTKGNMKSFVYDQKTQRLMAELDENNYGTFYEYDLEGGLVRIKKETEKGVFTIQETRSGNTKKQD